MHRKPDLFQIMVIYNAVFSLFRLILHEFSYEMWTEYNFLMDWPIDYFESFARTELSWLTKNIQTLFTGINFLIADFNNRLEKPFTHQNRNV